MRKIAIASDDGLATQHFGHCKEFMIFDTQNNEIINSQTIPNPGHKPGFLPSFLHSMKVDVIISGGMGGGAVDIFKEKNIEVIVGAKGSSKSVVLEYLQGRLKSTNAICHEHEKFDS